MAGSPALTTAARHSRSFTKSALPVLSFGMRVRSRDTYGFGGNEIRTAAHSRMSKWTVSHNMQPPVRLARFGNYLITAIVIDRQRAPCATPGPAFVWGCDRFGMQRPRVWMAMGGGSVPRCPPRHRACRYGHRHLGRGGRRPRWRAPASPGNNQAVRAFLDDVLRGVGTAEPPAEGGESRS